VAAGDTSAAFNILSKRSRDIDALTVAARLAELAGEVDQARTLEALVKEKKGPPPE